MTYGTTIKQPPAHHIISRINCFGVVLAFHALTVHGSSGNTTRDQRRRGYAIRYTGTEVVYYTGPGTDKNIRNSTLNDGDHLDSAQYPVVWRIT